jgi:hypothetical protein
MAPEERANYKISSAYWWHIETIESIEVPAGEFHDCFKLLFTSAPGEEYRWFCPGIGYVKIEGWGRHYIDSWELIQYVPPVINCNPCPWTVPFPLSNHSPDRVKSGTYRVFSNS